MVANCCSIEPQLNLQRILIMTANKSTVWLNFFLVFPLFFSILFSCAIAQQPNPPDYVTPTTVIGRLMIQDDVNMKMFSPYDSNYIIETYTSYINKDSIRPYEWSEHAKKDEIKFQLSLGFPLYRGLFGENSLLGASYTQRAWWQAFNGAQSSPFRETNYEPQIFTGFLVDYNLMGLIVDELEFGFNHQSNGRSEETSRSWNRLYFRTSASRGHFRVGLKAWYRFPSRHDNDDNPLITHYLGHYQLALGYVGDKTNLTARGHYNWNTGYGNAELGLSYTITNSIRLYAQLFTGYGESMIDYKHKQTRFGLGIMLNDLF